ncbi:MAG: N-acetyl-gamma-glutamyl-phosphate reductase [Deltaproteobacteria bacterium]|nr:N-acetyl-gamma-glutamyl-phosphate reductase [Deltaproteobacteria bacterium]
MIRVGIVGGSGYTGVQLMALLLSHPEVSLKWVTSRKFEGQPVFETFGALRSLTDLAFTKYSLDLLGEVDLVFTAVPHGQAMGIVSEVVQHGKRVIDLSADFRFQDVALYEQTYQPHTAPELAKRAVYGLPELFYGEIKEADLVGNPGCYPTSAILASAPLVQEGLWDSHFPIIVDAKSGVSGAGRDPNLTTHFPEADEGLTPYKVLVHRHQPEIASILQKSSNERGLVYFVPHLVPMNRGIVSTVYLRLKEAIALEDLHRLYEVFYNGKPFVRVLPTGKAPSSHHVRGSNFCDIGLALAPDGKTVVAMAAIDNLIKGASGQAVQNMNILAGFEESAGLAQPPLFP